MSRQLFEEARKVLTQEAAVKLDPVGREDKDIDNDGDSDKTDSYLKKRRGAISAAIAKGKNESNLSVEDIAKLKAILGEMKDKEEMEDEEEEDEMDDEKGVAEGAMSDLDADRKDRQYQSRQAKTTMKHIPNPTAGEKAAAKDIKPGIAGYRDRIDMLKSAEARGGLKKEEVDQVDEMKVKGKGYDNPENMRKAPEGDSKMSSMMPGYDERAARFLARQAKGTLVKGKAQSAPQKEDVDYEIIEKMHFQISDTPSFNDYLQAALKIAECKSLSELSEEDQKYIVGELEEAVANNDVGFIMEAESLSDMNDTVQRLRKAGHKVEDMGKDYRGNPYYVYVDKNSSLRRKVTYKNGQKMTQNMGRATPDKEEN